VLEVFAMSFSFRLAPIRRTSLIVAAVLFAAGFANAQSAPFQDQSSTKGYSSSQADLSQFAELALPDAPAPVTSVAGSGQYGQGGGGYQGGKHGLLHHLTFEAGGGANAPAGDKAYITWGGQFTVGGGVRFNKRLATLIEYQFIDDKLPGKIIAEAGAQGGHAHIWSFTVDPVFDLFPKASNDVYVTGGGGFYRKVTSFTDAQPGFYCDYFYGCGTVYTQQVVGHFSSNQGGFNVGGGYQHRFGSLYDDESHTAFFAEVRFVDVLTPAVTTQPNGLGTTTIAADTKLLPISLGIRW
jgi:hypothetical protein